MIWPLAVDTWGAEERQAIIDSIDTGKRTMGDQVAAFEEEFAAYVGAKHAVMVNSGSSANLLLVSALLYSERLSQGDTVVLPALGWSTTYAPFIQLGFKIELRDISAHTLNIIDPMGVHAKAACVVHALGNPCPIGGITMWIEDCCEALGSYYDDGAHVGTRGIGGTFSFFFSHQMSTGEGGMVITDDYELYCTMRGLRAHGWNRDDPLNRYMISNNDGWDFMVPGYNFRPLDLQGAVGRVQLRRLPEFLRARALNAVNVSKIVDEFPWIRLQEAGVKSSWMAFPMILDEDVNRQALKDALEKRDIATRPVLSGNIAYHAMARWMDIGGAYPGASLVHDRGFMIGNSSYPLTDEQLSTLSNVLRTFN